MLQLYDGESAFEEANIEEEHSQRFLATLQAALQQQSSAASHQPPSCDDAIARLSKTVRSMEQDKVLQVVGPQTASIIMQLATWDASGIVGASDRVTAVMGTLLSQLQQLRKDARHNAHPERHFYTSWEGFLQSQTFMAMLASFQQDCHLCSASTWQDFCAECLRTSVQSCSICHQKAISGRKPSHQLKECRGRGSFSLQDGQLEDCSRQSIAES